MKGIHGLIIAILLGLAGAAANYFYLNTEAQKKDMEAFIGIKKGVILTRMDRLTDDNMVKVEIPKNHVGNLKDYVFLWGELIGVKGKPVWRTIDCKTDTETEAVLLLKSDVVEPPPRDLELGKGERGVYIAVPRNCDTSHINPGSRISFRVSKPAGPTPAPKPTSVVPETAATPEGSGTTDLQPKPEDADVQPQVAGSSELIEPFVVVSIGNRLSTLEAQKGAKVAPAQQNVLIIRVSKNVPQEEQKYEKLVACMNRFGLNCYTIELLGKE